MIKIIYFYILYNIIHNTKKMRDQTLISSGHGCYSIKTHIKQPHNSDDYNQNSSFLLQIIKIFVFLAIIFIIYTAYWKESTIKDKDNTLQQPKVQNVSKALKEHKHLEQVFEANKISVPIIKQQNKMKCEVKKSQQLQQTLKNIKIFQLLHDPKNNAENIIKNYFKKIQLLYVVKHPKFTSPQRSDIQKAGGLTWFNLFDWDRKQSYKDIDKIFTDDNKYKWISDGKYLTIYSQQPIKPTLLVIDVPGGGTPPKNMYLFGISALDITLTNKNTLQSTFIKMADLQIGRNEIECDKPECAISYSMLMLIIQPVQVLKLQVYTSVYQFF